MPAPIDKGEKRYKEVKEWLTKKKGKPKPGDRLELEDQVEAGSGIEKIKREVEVL